MTPIQTQSIPALLAGKDIIGQSKTGSGKTAAFALPLLARLDVSGRRLQGVILCPTRELSAQVAREIRKLGRRMPGLQVLVVAGGQPLSGQREALAKGVHIIVGTPGRVLDHLGRGTLPLAQVAMVVLDEADRMLDMGFEKDMEAILGAMPKRRQTAFFSATFPGSIVAMSRAFQNQPVRITIEEQELEQPVIRQLLHEVRQEDKEYALLDVLRAHEAESALVFANHKAQVAELAAFLNQEGISASCLHGDLEQFERDREMAKFRNHSIRVLVATDVAARGIDVSGLDIVVNFDLPAKADTYIHRIGRTGRAGNKGIAIALVTRRDLSRLKAIESFLGFAIEREDLPKISAHSQRAPKAEIQNAAMTTFMISGGRKEKMRPGDILGALTGEAGSLPAAHVGKIEIHDHFSYVAVARASAMGALQSLKSGTIKGRRFNVEQVK